MPLIHPVNWQSVTTRRLVQDRLLPFERIGFEGLYDNSGASLTDAIRRFAGRDVPIRRFPWWLLHMLAPFGGFPREASEIAQYWRHPVRLDNTRLLQLIGTEPRTEPNRTLWDSLADMGCLTPDQKMKGLMRRVGRLSSPLRHMTTQERP